MLLIAALLIAGCSSGNEFPTAKVTGKITYRGKPVPTGTIMFVPEGNMPTATGEIQPDGTYQLTTYDANDGAVLGPHAVSITAIEEQKDVLPAQRSGTPEPIVPAKYMSHTTSGLTAEVKDEPNSLDFELKD